MCRTKPGLNVQLRGSQSVDELLIRVLTAGVRRSLGDSGFWLGPWEPDWACRHWGRVAVQEHHDMADLFPSVEPARRFFSFFLRCWQKLNMQLTAPPHTDNTQRLADLRQGEPAVCLNHLSSPQSQDLETKSSYQSSEHVILSFWWEGRITTLDSLSRIGRSGCGDLCVHGCVLVTFIKWN